MAEKQVTKPIVTEWILNLLAGKAHKGKVKLNGQFKDYEIFKTLQTDSTVRIYIYMESETGYVEEAQLLTSMGEVWAIKPYSIEKKDDGLVLAFEFEVVIKERGAVDGLPTN